MLTVIIEKLTAYMIGKGITPDEELVFGSDVCRFHIEGDSEGKRNGWCALNLGEFPFASFGSWKTGKTFTWQLKKPTTPEEMKLAKKAQTEARAKYRAAQSKKHEQATELANLLWNKAVPADRGHAYLFEKKIQPHGIRQLEGALLVPMYYGGEIASLQAIYPNGQKIFLKGGRVKACYFQLKNTPARPDKIFIAEGMATAATLKEHLLDADNYFVAAFTAGNLVSVAKAFRVAHPQAEIIMAADNDQWTPDNPGLKYARIAAATVGADIIYPDFEGMDTSSKPSDWNDYAALGGALCL